MSGQAAHVRIAVSAFAFECFHPLFTSRCHSPNFFFMFFTVQMLVHIIFSTRFIITSMTIKSFFYVIIFIAFLHFMFIILHRFQYRSRFCNRIHITCNIFVHGKFYFIYNFLSKLFFTFIIYFGRLLLFATKCYFLLQIATFSTSGFLDRKTPHHKSCHQSAPTK